MGLSPSDLKAQTNQWPTSPSACPRAVALARRESGRRCSRQNERRAGNNGSMADVDWELRETGPPNAERTALLLPGGMRGAGSYAEVEAEPVLGSTRLVSATLPVNAGTTSS